MNIVKNVAMNIVKNVATNIDRNVATMLHLMLWMMLFQIFVANFSEKTFVATFSKIFLQFFVPTSEF